MGTIQIKGTIDLSQFWPTGKSDADTTKIKIKIDEDAFNYYSGSTSKPKKTNVFFTGKVKPASGKAIRPIKYAGTTRQYITTRLEGIDAPELHYRFYDPATLSKYKGDTNFKKYNIDYRQYFSEIATEALASMLTKYADNTNMVPCVFVSDNINKPSDVCDIYGRFVGNILVDNKKININQWLLRQGWVFPAFYNSTLKPEIATLTNLYKKAKTKPDTALINYSDKLLKFDYDLLFRLGGPSNPSKDKDNMILPKLFRRSCCYSILSKAGILSAGFTDYLKSKKDDLLIMVSDYENYQKSKNKVKFVGLRHLIDIFKKDTLTEDTASIVFIEKGSLLINPDTKKEITSF